MPRAIGAQVDVFARVGRPVVSGFRVVPVRAILWGAGGGKATYGGCGGWVDWQGLLIPGTALKLVVGQGGSTSLGAPFGGGGELFSTNNGAGSGGGYTGLFVGTVDIANALAVAGGGAGGGGTPYYGGPGGGFGGDGTGRNGQDGGGTRRYGTGGTSSAGGSGGLDGGYDGAALQGGRQEVDAASSPEAEDSAGGGGYYGGGGGSRMVSAGVGSGGGGSTYGKPTQSFTIDGNAFTFTCTRTYSGVATGTTVPPQTGHADYPGSVAAAQQNGYAVIIIDGVKTTYAYTGSVIDLAA